MKQFSRALIVVFMSASPLLAQSEANVSTAREVAKQGLLAYDAGNYEEAAEKLSRAYQVVKLPTLALYTARALEKAGRFVEASELYLQAKRLDASRGDRGAQERAKKAAAKERAALLPRIPKLRVELKGATSSEAQVYIDGQLVASAFVGVAQLIDPGTHRIAAKLGEQEVVEEVSLAEGEERSITLRLEPTKPSEEGANSDVLSASEDPGVDTGTSGTGQRTAGWIGVGVGGVGLIFGGITGALAIDKQNDLEENGCVDGHCYVDQASDVDSYNLLRTLSTVGLATGGIGMVTGITLLLTASEDEADAVRVTPYVGVTSIGLTGRF